MSEFSALAASPAVEGAFYFGAYNVASTVVGGRAGSFVAGAGGVGVGRFAWGRADGRVFNARNSPEDLLGLVVPRIGPGVDWRVVYYDDATRTWRIREGLVLSMLASGNVWVRFPLGAIPGQPVYANVLDGSALSGYSDDGELTPWSVISPAAAGGLAIITTWSRPT